MENLLAHSHAILVHFTLGLFVTGLIVEIIGLLLDHYKTRFAGAIMVIAGGTAGLMTMLTGEYAEHNVEELLTAGADQALEHHEEWGEWAGYVLGLTAVTRISLFWLKNRLMEATYLVLGGIALVVLLITAQYGGKVTHSGHPHTSITGAAPSGQTLGTTNEYDEEGYEDE